MYGNSLTLLLVFVLGLPLHTLSQDIMINEVMASNSSTISDEDGDFCDWIEIHNFGDQSLNLKGFGLSDNYNDPFRWTFPDVIIEPGEYLLVWASGKNRKEDKYSLHTIFSIDTSGEEVLISGPGGEMIDFLEPTSIPTDISIGRKPGEGKEWNFFDRPTPGAPNTGAAYKGILEPPGFTHEGGFYSASFMLGLEAEKGARIYFTLDGSVPDPLNTAGSTFQYKNGYPMHPHDSPAPFAEGFFQSHPYINPVLISDMSGGEGIAGINTTFTPQPELPAGDVMRGRVVRARAFSEGYLPSPVVTNTYLVGNMVHERFGLPVISVSLPDTSLFDYYRGIYVAGRAFDTWRENNPAEPVWPAAPANWGYRGPDWEREAHIELFCPRGELEFKQGLGVRIHGGWSRSNRKKSLRLYARNIYDTENDIRHVFFPGPGRPGPAEGDSDVFKRILLRSGGNATQVIRDVVAQDMMAGMNAGVQRALPAVHFINGVYWGLVNIRDRQDRYYIAYEYDIDPDNVIILNSPYRPIDYHQIEEGRQEDTGFFDQVYGFITGNDMADNEKFGLLATELDIDSYIDYYIGMIYLANADWGGRDNPGSKHFRLWRVRETSPDPFKDGKWRVLVWDLDNAFTDVNYTLLTDVMDPSAEASAMLLGMMENEEFRRNFINRFADMMNSDFLPSHGAALLDNRLQAVIGEALHDMDRWGVNPVEGSSHIRDFIKRRPGFQRGEIMDLFGLPGTARVNLNTDPARGRIRINSIEISGDLPGVKDPANWEGIYFKGVPVEVEAIPGEGMIFSHWTGLPAGSPARTSIDLKGDTSITAVFRDGLLHYWDFNSLTESYAPDTIIADHSLFYPDAFLMTGAAGNLRVVDDGSQINERRGSGSGRALLVEGRQGSSEIIFSTPTTGHKNLNFSYAAKGLSSGKTLKSVFVSPDGGKNWELVQPGVMLTAEYRLYENELAGIGWTGNNPDLMIKIELSDEDGGGAVFDNIAVSEERLGFRNTLLPPGKRGSDYVARLEAAFGEAPFFYEIVSGSLPKGLQLSDGGYISGIPANEGSYSFEVEVRDAQRQYSRRSFRVRVFGEDLVHFWHFNDMEIGMPDTIFADYSAGKETAYICYPGEGDAWIDRVEGSELNSRSGVSAGYGLRVRNPSNRRELRFSAPSTGFDHLLLSYAVHRTLNGAGWQLLQYSADGGLNWESLGPPYRITSDYQVKTFDLRYLENAGDNPSLMFRIFFLGPESAGQSGNNRFDNIVLKGFADPGAGRREELFVYPNPVTGRTIYLLREENISLFDTSGRLIIRWENSGILHLPVLSPGYYILRAEDGRFARIFYPG